MLDRPLWVLADQMEPEDGVVWIHDSDERQTMATSLRPDSKSLKALIPDRPAPENGDPAALTG